MVRFKDDYRILVKGRIKKRGREVIKALQMALKESDLELSDDKTSIVVFCRKDSSDLGFRSTNGIMLCILRSSPNLIFLSNLRMVPRARLSCWFLRRAFGEELVSKFLDSPDCENIHPYAAPFTRCGQQDCEREFYRGLLGKEVRNDFRPTFEFSEGALE